MEIQFNSLCVLSRFVTVAESRELLSDSPQMIPFLLSAHEHARQQSDFRATRFTSQYGAQQFLELLSSFSSASDEFCSEVVRLGGLREVAAALLLDPNRTAPRSTYFFYCDVLYATNTLLHILLAENSRHTATVRNDQDIPNGICLNLEKFLSLRL